MDGPSIIWKRVLSLYIYTVLLSKLDPLELSSRGIGDGWPVIDDEAWLVAAKFHWNGVFVGVVVADRSLLMDF